MGIVEAVQIGKSYIANDGPVAGETGICVEAWETGFGHKFLKLKTSSGVHSMRASDVKRVKSKKKTGKKK